jgi:hypothetical protein
VVRPSCPSMRENALNAAGDRAVKKKTAFYQRRVEARGEIFVAAPLYAHGGEHPATTAFIKELAKHTGIPIWQIGVELRRGVEEGQGRALLNAEFGAIPYHARNRALTAQAVVRQVAVNVPATSEGVNRSPLPVADRVEVVARRVAEPQNLSLVRARTPLLSLAVPNPTLAENAREVEFVHGPVWNAWQTEASMPVKCQREESSPEAHEQSAEVLVKRRSVSRPLAEPAGEASFGVVVAIQGVVCCGLVVLAAHSHEWSARVVFFVIALVFGANTVAFVVEAIGKWTRGIGGGSVCAVGGAKVEKPHRVDTASE